MQSNSECPKCGAEIPANASPGFCPGCALLSIGLENSDPDPLPGKLLPGTAVGRYEIVASLGSGGSGDVYTGRQKGDVALEVAIKVLRSSAPSDRIMARFEAERDAMLRMDHPGIARVLDAGFLDDGRPFVAMEHIGGAPLNEFLKARTLTLTEQLDLFIQICAAVQHAHLKGVLHRDLKPANILVLPGGDPKLIDFGIARSLDRPSELDALFTQHAEILGTPAYMSPEQTFGGNADVDVRSDVYALGIILYEILTGTPPIAPETLREMSIDTACRTIRETPAPRPSSLVGEIDADLDAVALKALAKEPARRYQSANALAEDLQRFINNEPVAAKAPTASYKLGKFVRRHRTPVAAAVLIFLTVISAAVISLYQAKQARMARDAEQAAAELATSRLDASEDLIQFMVIDLYGQLKPVGKLEALSSTAEKVEAFYKKLGPGERSIASLIHQGKAYDYLGRVRSAQGKGAQAIATFQLGLDLLTPLFEKFPQEEGIADTVSSIWESLANHHIRQHDPAAAGQAFDKSAAIIDQQLKNDPGNVKWSNYAIGQLINRGALLANQQQWQSSLDFLERARKLANKDTDSKTRILIEQNACRALAQLGRLDEAETAGKKSVELNNAELAQSPDDTTLLMRSADLITNLSAVQFNRKDFPAVIASNLKIVDIQEKLLAFEPDNIYWRDRLAETYRRLAMGYQSSDPEKQCAAASKAVAVREPIALAPEASDALKKNFLLDINYFEMAASKVGKWRDAYALRVKTHQLQLDKTSSAHRIGRAAACIAVDGDPDFRNLSLWILTKYPITESQRIEEEWPVSGDTPQPAADMPRLLDAIQSGRITVPEPWKRELTQP